MKHNTDCEKMLVKPKRCDIVLKDYTVEGRTLLGISEIVLNRRLCKTCSSSGGTRIGKIMAQCIQNMLVYNIRVSKGSVATHFGCGGIFNDNFIAILPESLPVIQL